VKKIKLRVIIQLVIFALVLLIAVNHSLEESGGGLPLLSSASLHAICPFGGVVSIHTLITSGTFVKKIHESSMVLMYIVFAAALFLGPVFCGWICPFGTFQEWVGRLGKRLFKKRYNNVVPYKLDRVLRYLRYVLLLLVLVNTARSVELMFTNIDPYYALFNLWTGEVALSAYIILAVVFLLSLVMERPFCKYACPYGAVLGLTNLFRFIPLRRNKNSCIDCDACNRSCPMNIPVSTSGVVRNHQCISCFECTSEDGVCPVPETLNFTTKLKETSNEN